MSRSEITGGDIVRRTNVNSRLWQDITFANAVDEIVRESRKSRRRTRGEVVGKLCEGETVSVGLYKYRFREV